MSDEMAIRRCWVMHPRKHVCLACHDRARCSELLEAAMAPAAPQPAPAQSDELRGQVLADIADECERQDARWGAGRMLPDGTGGQHFPLMMADAQDFCDMAEADGTLTWRHILEEEHYEALAETDPARLRAELVQVAAVCCQWIECIDRRSEKE